MTARPLILAAFLAAACGAAGPSPELVDARRAYDRARTGETAALVPDQVVEARHALDRAEKAENGSAKERNLAYVAQRVAELAIANGQISAAERDRARAEADYTRLLETHAKSRSRELEAAERRLAVTRGQLEQATEQAQTTEGQLAAEREARRKAEEETQAALQSLERIAEVKQEAKETVITLNGAVLFEFGKAVLLPIARTRLAEVAKALLEMEEGSTIIVEGHTDSRGSSDANRALSQGRAEAVVGFLVSQGVDPARIRAVGKGEDEPVANNTSSEGRANNRRVEIRVLPPGKNAASP